MYWVVSYCLGVAAPTLHSPAPEETPEEDSLWQALLRQAAQHAVLVKEAKVSPHPEMHQQQPQSLLGPMHASEGRLGGEIVCQGCTRTPLLSINEA